MDRTPARKPSRFLAALDSLTTVHQSFALWRQGAELVGEDSFGNRYFRVRRKLRKGSTPVGRPMEERRYVTYAGEPEASKVPPEWHGWLHHQQEDPPAADNPLRRPWQKPHLPNMTGTALAYRPRGSQLRDGKRPHATGDYEAWIPE